MPVDSAVPTDWWSKQTIHVLTPYLQAAQHTIRIASGFFTIQGYDLIRQHLDGKQVFILVGYDEAARELLRTRLIAAVMEHLRQWDAANRRTAVLDLVAKLERGEIQIIEQSPSDSVEARLRQKDHAKLFIFDEDRVIVGSANLTMTGLRNNVEALSALDDAARVQLWLQWYQKYWTDPDSEDITATLLDVLRKWLALAPPFHVYLRTLSALVTPTRVPPPRKSYRQPVRFQEVVIERLLRQLNAYSGSMLVASTGLGKTVMAMDVAYKLRAKSRVDHVIVFAPLQVQPDWQQVFDEAGIHCQIFTRDLLDQPDIGAKPESAMGKMLVALERVDDKYLIIVDESQRYRNRLRAFDGLKRHSFVRLRNVVEEQKALILLLTATPYATTVEDINNQLYLLPHSGPSTYLNPKGQYFIPGTRDDESPPRAWRVQESDECFSEFVDLPVTTVISTAQVARNFAAHTEEGDYLEFPGGQQWIPRISISKISVPLLEQAAMQNALDRGCFKHELVRYMTRGKGGATQVNVQNQAEVSWSSSPAALLEVVKKTIEGSYRVRFLMDQGKRSALLLPIYESLTRLEWQDDQKFVALARLVATARAQNRKVLIFTERHATAVYLEENLPKAVPKLGVASTSKRKGPNGYDLKNFRKEVVELICDFAPEANKGKLPKGHKPQPLDVLVVTDAYSAGVNLQDAAVVIHYDLAWTPDVLIQRAGRILRFWKSPRLIDFYVFVGRFQEESELRQRTYRVEERLRKLTERGRQAQQFSAIPIIPESDSVELLSLADLAQTVTIERLGLADTTQLGEYQNTSQFLRHLTVLQDNQELAATIPDDITSALDYLGSTPKLFLLLRHQGAYHWVVYDMQHKQFEDYTEDRMYGLIESQASTPCAEVDSNVIEEAVQACRSKWAQENRIEDPGSVERICALYLQPKAVAGLFSGEQELKAAVTQIR